MSWKIVRAWSAAGVPSLIGAGMRVRGDLSSGGEVHVDGLVEGDIRCGVVVVGERGVVTGAIVAERIQVFGTVEGHLDGQAVVLAATAKVTGDITHDSLSIESGAEIEGFCGRRAPARAVEAAPAPVAVDGERQLLDRARAEAAEAVASGRPIQLPARLAIEG